MCNLGKLNNQYFTIIITSLKLIRASGLPVGTIEIEG